MIAVSFAAARRASALMLLAIAGSAALAAPLPTVPPPTLAPGFRIDWAQIAESPHSITDAYNALAGVGFTVLDRVTQYQTFIDLSDASVPFGGADPRFAVRVSGFITLTAADTYTFLSIHDDGIRVVVGGEEVILYPTDTATIESDSAPFALAPGVYAYEAVSWEQGGVFTLRLGIDSATTGRVFLAGSHDVPEPMAPALTLLGLLAAGVVGRRRTR